jgi:YVTN family beta-propeller protein
MPPSIDASLPQPTTTLSSSQGMLARRLLSFITMMSATGMLAANAHAAGDKVKGEPASGCRVLHKISVPGDGGYDFVYLDEAAHRLYAAHSTEVAVIDTTSQSVIGVIAGLAGAHGISVAPGVGKGFITNGKSDMVTVFDPKTLKATGEIKSTGKSPDALTYDPASRQLFVFNHASGEVTVIEPGTNKVTTTLNVGGALEVGRADGHGNVWVNVEDRSEIVRIDSKKMVVAGRYPLAPCEEPTGLAVDAKHGRVFVGCGNKMMVVVNATTSKVVTTVAIGPGVDGTEFDPTTGDVFNACGKDGTLSVIHQDTADRYHVVQNLSTQLGARTLAVDTSSHRVFLAAAQFGDKPAPSEITPKPRAPILPGTFVVLVVGK